MKVVSSALAIAIFFVVAGRCLAGEAGMVGRFDVVPVGDKAILIDTVTGSTWLLTKSPSADNRSGHVWERIPAPWKSPAPAMSTQPQLLAPPITAKSPQDGLKDLPKGSKDKAEKADGKTKE